MDARTREQRNTEILRLRALGWTLAAIGKHVGLTRQGVHYIIKRRLEQIRKEHTQHPNQ